MNQFLRIGRELDVSDDDFCLEREGQLSERQADTYRDISYMID
jgi:hypothetical protein